MTTNNGAKIGRETATGQWKNAYGVCFPFNINGRYFIFGHKISKDEGGNVTPGYWFIQEMDLPDKDFVWIEARGNNSYVYCELDSNGTQGKQIDTRKTITVEAGAPYLYAVLIKNDNSVDFPSGAMLVIKRPDGSVYNQESNLENLLVKMSGSSLRSLIVKNPPPGDWFITLTVPENVDFRFELQTLPSQAIGETINNSLKKAYSTSEGSQRLHKRALGEESVAVSIMSSIAMTAIGFMVAGPAGAGIAFALGGLVTAATAGKMSDFSSVDLCRSRLGLPSGAIQISNNLTFSQPQPPIFVGMVRIATWNVYHGNLQVGVDPYYNQPRLQQLQDRVNELVNYGSQNNIDLIAFQEMPLSILNNPNHQIFTTIANTNYYHVIVNSEYPPRPNINAPPPASATTDGYLILYNPTVFNLLNNAAGNQWEFFQPQDFLQGLSQARPPVQLQFQMAGTNTLFNFLTWHTEPQRAFASNHVQTAYNLLIQQGGNWIIAGDLNIFENQLPQGVVNQHHLTHDGQTLDHIITSGTVVDPHPNPANPNPMIIGQNGVPVNPITVTNAQWGSFWSDAHYVLFGLVWF